MIITMCLQAHPCAVYISTSYSDIYRLAGLTLVQHRQELSGRKLCTRLDRGKWLQSSYSCVTMRRDSTRTNATQHLSYEFLCEHNLAKTGRMLAACWKVPLDEEQTAH